MRVSAMVAIVDMATRGAAMAADMVTRGAIMAAAMGRDNGYSDHGYSHNG